MKKRRQLHYLQILWAEQNASAFNLAWFEFVDFRKWHLKHRRILKAMCCTNKASVRHVASRRVRWKSLLAKTQPKRWMVLRRCSRHTKSLDVTLHSFIRQTFLPRSILTASKQKNCRVHVWLYHLSFGKIRSESTVLGLDYPWIWLPTYISNSDKSSFNGFSKEENFLHSWTFWFCNFLPTESVGALKTQVVSCFLMSTICKPVYAKIKQLPEVWGKSPQKKYYDWNRWRILD